MKLVQDWTGFMTPLWIEAAGLFGEESHLLSNISHKSSDFCSEDEPTHQNQNPSKDPQRQICLETKQNQDPSNQMTEDINKKSREDWNAVTLIIYCLIPDGGANRIWLLELLGVSVAVKRQEARVPLKKYESWK